MVSGWETFDAMSPNTNATTAEPASVTKSSMLPVSTGADKPWWTYNHAVGAAMAAAYRMIRQWFSLARPYLLFRPS